MTALIHDNPKLYILANLVVMTITKYICPYAICMMVRIIRLIPETCIKTEPTHKGVPSQSP
jgi:hypothetical protein